MGNMFRQFSVFIPLSSNTLEWSKRYIGSSRHRGSCKTECLDINDPNDYIGFKTEYQPDGILIYDMECGKPIFTAFTIQLLLQHDASEEIVLFTWAESCDEPKSGCFSGGLAIITKDDIEFQLTPDDVLDEYMLA